MAMTRGRRLRLRSDGLVHARGHFDSSERKGGSTLCNKSYTIVEDDDRHGWNDEADIVDAPLTCIVCSL